MASAGYSGTPLAKKLGLRPGARAFLRGVPPELEPVFDELSRQTKLQGPLDYLHLFETNRDALSREFPRLADALDDAGMIWISWPKKSSGRPTTLDENLVRALGLATGLVDVKVCAVDETWSGLKFVRRLSDRKPASASNRKPSKRAARRA